MVVGCEGSYEKMGVCDVPAYDPNEGRPYNLSDPNMPFCPEPQEGARRFNQDDIEKLRRRLEGPDACELRELGVARGIARRLREEMIYGTPTTGQPYREQDVPTSQNLPLFMEFVFEILAGKKDIGEGYE